MKFFAASIFLLLFLLASCTNKQPQRDIDQNQPVEKYNYKIYIFDIGQGSAALFDDGTKKMLIDTGNDARIIEYLNKLGISKIDILMLTHPDKDHIGKADDILKNFEVSSIVYNGQDSNTLEFGNLMGYISTNNINIITANVSSDFSFPILNPQLSFYSNDNDNSIVGFISFGDLDIFIGGDCEKKCEENLDLPHRAEIYIVNHTSKN